jgi:hypothetical protein
MRWWDYAFNGFFGLLFAAIALLSGAQAVVFGAMHRYLLAFPIGLLSCLSSAMVLHVIRTTQRWHSDQKVMDYHAEIIADAVVRGDYKAADRELKLARSFVESRR